MLNEELLIEQYSGLIATTINRYVKMNTCKSYISAEDVYQMGYLGLLKAIRTFDDSKNNSFASYAIPVIRNTIYSELKEDNSIESFDSFDDEENISLLTHPSFIKNYDNKTDDRVFSEAQRTLLFTIAKKYNGIAKKGVIAIQLLTEGYSYKSIAKKFNTTDKNITAWVSRARSKLKKEKDILLFLNKK